MIEQSDEPENKENEGGQVSDYRPLKQNDTKTLTDVDVDEESYMKTFEVVPESIIVSSESNMEPDTKLDSSGGRKQSSNVDYDSKARSNSVSSDIATPSCVKKSGSFISRLQSSGDDSNGSNIPSSIVNALSSISSSITSNFTSMNSTNESVNNASSLTIETASTSTRLSLISESREDIFYKKAALERKNLISLTKLIVKDLISSSLLASRKIEENDNTVHLNNYFTLIDRVLKHGLKQNILSNKSTSLWNCLDSLTKYLKESTLMSESVRSLANTKTPDGKVKAWVRLAMMQKKLPEYFNELLANKNVLLQDIYHNFAFMLNDEAQVFSGLIIGVNVIDCNFFVKDANFDLMDDVIDLSPYLKAANIYDEDQEKANLEDLSTYKAGENLTAILDQKNYLEEWNKRLESKISGLQSKVKFLEEQNSKLEMEAKVSEARISKLQGRQSETLSEKQPSVSAFTDVFKNLMSSSNVTNSNKQADSVSQYSAHSRREIQPDPVSKSSQDQSCRKSVEEIEQSQEQTDIPNQVNNSEEVVASSTTSTEHKSTLAEELELKRKISSLEGELIGLKERAGILEASYRSALEKIKVLERDLDVQTSINADKETTIKMYEKDIRDKQAQVESLRVSLNDAKKLNSDLSERLNDTSAKLKDRIKIVSSLQESLDKWKLENRTLATRLQDKQTALKAVAGDLEKATRNIEDLKKYNAKINEELRKERESGQSSSETLETQRAQISELRAELTRLEHELDDVRPYKNHNSELELRCREYEQSLEEIGAQLRESRLEVENLKENSAVFLDSQWMDSKSVKSCQLCGETFSVTRRKHHCRLCGNVFCQTCSDNKMELASSAKPVRVCDTCHSFLLAKFVKSSST